ncbi:Protein of unknown function (DUF4232) [Parafrankia irregularis]|uniref:DUF4232 domain-containing protein n=2 Tax=Parafrankia TaxID=2994362 RepID=A0A0S4QW21_9ACTN|nr:DUF4232 domain-containing protein [Parafrankia irregularis]MBE3206435.1 DUF4232 domain-containing protein [Parafrankia sp. CH37]CUU59883.1 Protein of unknown function (DUF4232) [Parafrankia irregularis]
MRRMTGAFLMGALTAGALAVDGGAATAAARTVSRCASAALVPAVVREDGAAGTIYRTIEYRNSGHQACVISGFPTVELVDRRGRVLGGPSGHSGAVGAPVTLRPGGVTEFTLIASNMAGSIEGCTDPGTYRPAVGARVTPPGGGRSRFIPLTQDACVAPGLSTLSVTAVGHVLPGS